MSGRGYLMRAGVAVLAVGALAGGFLGVHTVTAAEDGPVMAALPAVDGTLVADAASFDRVASVVPAASVLALTPPGAGDSTATGPVAGALVVSPYAAWAARVAQQTGIPERALQAYGAAETSVRRAQPACHLSWATLAGLANIESRHGTYQGRRLGADGRSTPPIIGIALDGRPGVAAIPDTDGGRLDGDTVWDRAVGPFQFIPSTWARWGADGNGDGVADPQNIDDAALAAGRYLCADGKDLATSAGWSRAVLSYNNSVEYLHDVFDGADRYARQSAAAS